VEKNSIGSFVEMKAVILCAGYGTRLKPLTNTVPKPMVKVMGIPIVEYTIGLLINSGIKDIYINRHHLPEAFDNLCIPEGVNIEFSYEPEILGTSGGILSFENQLKNDDFLVVNGDVLFNLDIDELIATHKKSKKIATMVLKNKENDSVTSVFKDDFSNVVGIGGNNDGVYRELMFTGIHILSPEFFNIVKRTDPPSCVVKDFYIPYIQNSGKIGAYVVDESKGFFWKEIGNLKQYLDCNLWMIQSANELTLKGFYELFINEYWEGIIDGETVTEVVEGIWLGDNVVIDPAATLIQPVFVGPGTVIQKGSVVGPNVILDTDVTVGENSVVTESVVLEGVLIKDYTTVSKMVISDNFKYRS
jgi:NDP-sugar pyrophosphorylase family protein